MASLQLSWINMYSFTSLLWGTLGMQPYCNIKIRIVSQRDSSYSSGSSTAWGLTACHKKKAAFKIYCQGVLKMSQRCFSILICISSLPVSCVGCSYLHIFREKQMSAIKAIIELIQFLGISQDLQTHLLMTLCICCDKCENI